MNDLKAIRGFVCESFCAEAPLRDVRVHAGRSSDASMLEDRRIRHALEHVLSNPDVHSILSSEGNLDKTTLQGIVQGALQAYSREHGVLKLVEELRERIGDFNRSDFLLDRIPLAILRCRVHGSLVQGDASPEVSGTPELKSYELGRIVLKQGLNATRDELNRKTRVLDIQCELAPNLYESPISALVLGIAQDVFLYPKIAEILHHKTTRSEDDRFTVKVVSCLSVPEADDPKEQALHLVEMRVFENAVNEVYSRCSNLGNAHRCLSAPVAEMMFYKSKRLRYDTPLGIALGNYLHWQSATEVGEVDPAELLDLFQAQIRDCRVVKAPPVAIGRAYFNSQFRNLLCNSLGLKTPEQIAAFELRVRAYRDLRTQGIKDAPINSALLNRLMAIAPVKARDDAMQILRRDSSSETMVFEIEDLT